MELSGFFILPFSPVSSSFVSTSSFVNHTIISSVQALTSKSKYHIFKLAGGNQSNTTRISVWPSSFCNIQK